MSVAVQEKTALTTCGWWLNQQRLRQVLGLLWLIDGLFQLQPRMFTMNMVNGVMVPMTQGQPGIIHQNLTWITQLTTHNLTLVNIVIAVVQVVLGLLLVTGAYTRQAIIASAIWALGVWYGGEGLSMLLTGQGSVLTGAPGAVLLYPLLGAVIFPRKEDPNSPRAKAYAGLISRRTLRYVYGSLWIFFAVLQFQPYWWERGQIAGAVQGMVGMGGWNSVLVDPTLNGVAGHVSGNEAAWNLALIVLLAGVGASILLSDDISALIILPASAVVSFFIWWIAEAFGGILSGMATDFNSGLLLIFIALACMPLPKFGGAGVVRPATTSPALGPTI